MQETASGYYLMYAPARIGRRKPRADPGAVAVDAANGVQSGVYEIRVRGGNRHHSSTVGSRGQGTRLLS